MENITRSDLELVNQLCQRTYSGNRLLSNANTEEHSQLTSIKRKLRVIADFFATKYGLDFGPFTTGISSGNPIAIGGTRFNNIWSGLFKGAENKQYSAQISFVMDRLEPCLNVGFYFGAASAHNFSADERQILETRLSDLGNNLSNYLINYPEARINYKNLFDNGFQAISSGDRILPEQWIKNIAKNTAGSRLIAKIHPNDLGYIENSIIDSFVAQVMFLMTGVENNDQVNPTYLSKPLTPEQRAKQAEQRAIIGLNGELFVMQMEKQKLVTLGIEMEEYPRHVALESASYGYDILSLDEDGSQILIEVKTTIRTPNDPDSKKFFISTNEVETLKKNKIAYKIYRVYDINDKPSCEIVDFENGQLSPDGYILKY
ncbi:MAG: DUF3883 domain-containing protein [Bacteroidetes bacterium]|nr:MAG: DUF3883 domain-containing protein [Bacteroidota bacterium]